MTIKLRPKQLEQLNQVQGQKQQLTNAYNDCNLREAALLELILEENKVEMHKVSEVKLEEGALVLTFKEVKTKKKSESIA